MMLLLLCKNMRFVLIAKVIKDHTPDRGFS